MDATLDPLLDLRMLARYNAWANGLLYERLGAVSEDVLTAPHPGPLGGILGMLGHIHAVGLIWKAHLTGGRHGLTIRNLDPLPPLVELSGMQSTLDRWYIDFATTQSAASLAETVRFSFLDGGAGAMRRIDMLQHVVQHGSYHRGNIGTLLWAAGSRPPTMDLPVYIRDVVQRATA